VSAAATAGGQSLTVHQWLTRLAPDYLRRFGAAMPARQREVLETILSCRTPARGGELFACPDGHGFDYRYHSCNDRHCPLCGQTDADAWFQRQRQRLLLPTPYFFGTFTAPEPLRLWIRSHLQIGLDLFFAASSQALHDLAANPRRLGAQLGMLGVLHTWSRTLIFHPHIHYLIAGGGLSPDDRSWIAAKAFLFHHQALGDHGRTLFKERLQREHPGLFKEIPATVWKTHWNVGIQAAGSGENPLRYLARYVFKTATGNRLVQELPDGRLRWPYRDSRTQQNTAIALEPFEWMRRFLQHILPPYFARVRTFGFFHPAAKVRLNRVRALLHEKPLLTPVEKETWQPPQPEEEQAPSPAGAKPPAAPPPAGRDAKTTAPCGPICPHCHKVMLRVGAWRTPQDLLHLFAAWRALRRPDTLSREAHRGLLRGHPP
jgi:hypothetical protein